MQPVKFEEYQGDAKELMLDGPVADAVLGLEGRYLLLYLKTLRKIAVYDANAAGIIHEIPVAAEDAAIAAGAEKLVVVNTMQRLIERWSLLTWEREAVRPLPSSGDFQDLAMGYASAGPILMHWCPGPHSPFNLPYTLVDLETLDTVPDVTNIWPTYCDWVDRGRTILRAAATGRVFGLWDMEPNGGDHMVVLRCSGTQVRIAAQDESAGHVCPNSDGSAILTGIGVFTPSLLPREPDLRKPMPRIPTTHPHFHVAVPTDPRRQDNMGDEPFQGQTARLCLTPSCEELTTLPIGELGKCDRDTWGSDRLTVDKRVTYIPQAGQVVTIPFSNDRLIVTPFNLRDALKKVDFEYLFISSSPSWACQRGKDFSYQITIESNSDDAHVELSAAPDGMALSKTGLLSWRVPENMKERSVFVILTARTGSRTTLQAFQLVVR